jgi:hypothetical protein
MAVIKIVPMPGVAVVGPQGPKGDTGNTGPQGLAGNNGTNGADALWSYNGEYNPGAGYAVGDVVTFDGQLWYRKNSNGGNVGDTPSEGFIWDLLASKGADAELPIGVNSSFTIGNQTFNIVNGIITSIDVNIQV